MNLVLANLFYDVPRDQNIGSAEYDGFQSQNIRYVASHLEKSVGTEIGRACILLISILRPPIKGLFLGK